MPVLVLALSLALVLTLVLVLVALMLLRLPLMRRHPTAPRGLVPPALTGRQRTCGCHQRRRERKRMRHCPTRSLRPPAARGARD